jgi:hypothetical protein
VRLSPEGGALLRGIRTRNTEVLRSALDQLDDDERRVVREAIPVLEHLSDRLQALERPEPDGSRSADPTSARGAG